MDLFNRLGEDGSRGLNWPNDSIHFSEAGADVVAGMVVFGFPDELLKYGVWEAWR